MNPYTNLTEALEGLICQGYNISFIAKKNFINARNHNCKINYNEIVVNYAYHFWDPDPKLDAILYGFYSKKHCIKGLIIISCSMLLEIDSQEIEKQER
ncbi:MULTISPECIES: hypothetical protein [Flavobacterium]|jgi:hypothetical protein|uniref:Uncharacterized protein n=1 Tax=Flavobacterium piscisymbiosum TaxID=2893753 RepID=A0ABS8MJV7_9FLAO|nr:MULTISPECIES: hypothetical protein [unclassified Flavobacterium]KRB55420.1 hypothetical protein ASD98_12100 [Flavobacterium sp. Root186]MCC9064970.1 hypothetical protein [Flavobacterium sp. F-30]